MSSKNIGNDFTVDISYLASAGRVAVHLSKRVRSPGDKLKYAFLMIWGERE